jgi:uncharacterized membrane protein
MKLQINFAVTAPMNLRSKTINLLKSMNIWLRQAPLCHSIPERCFVYKNRHLPICARCTGILFGGILSLFFLNIFNLNFSFQTSFILAVPMIIDGGLQYLNYIISNNNRRFLTGLFCGIATVIFSQNMTLLLLRFTNI